MAVVLTPAEARKLGLSVPKSARARPRDRSEAHGGYLTVCHACSTQFDKAAAEDRHVNETGHARYEVVL